MDEEWAQAGKKLTKQSTPRSNSLSLKHVVCPKAATVVVVDVVVVVVVVLPAFLQFVASKFSNPIPPNHRGFKGSPHNGTVWSKSDKDLVSQWNESLPGPCGTAIQQQPELRSSMFVSQVATVASV